MIVIENFENVTKEIYNFRIKNFNEDKTNQIELFYYFQVYGIDEDIEFQLSNLTTNEIIKFKNSVSSKFSFGLEVESIEYSFEINVSDNIPKDNTKINLKIFVET